MADTKISALTAATTPLAGTEVLPIVQSGVTKQVSVADLTAGRAVSASSLTLTGSPLAATSGGTGQSSYAVGDLLYASSTTALSKLADVATGNALISGGVGIAPSWGKIGLTTHVSGTLGATNGGTGLSSATTGDLLYASGTNTWASLADVATGNALISGGVGVAPSWGKVGLTTHISGTLAVGNGGTGNTTGAATAVTSNATTGVMQIVGPAASTTRVMTIPNANFTAARTDAAQSFTGNQTLSDGNLVIGTTGKGITSSVASLVYETTASGANHNFVINGYSRLLIKETQIQTGYSGGYGNVIIGLDTPTADGVAKMFLQSTNTSYNWAIANNWYYGGACEFHPSTAAGGTTYGAPVMYITYGGAAYNSTGTWGTISDLKLKTNIEPARNYLEDLCKVNVVKYNLKTDPDAPKMLGVIAQELEQVFPGLVDVAEEMSERQKIIDGVLQVDENGDPQMEQYKTGEVTKTVKYSIFVPMLLTAVQELSQQVKMLQSEMKAMKG